MEPELILQRCRIFQNKAREIVTLPYVEARTFYRVLDDLVQNGRQVRISFPEERLDADSALLGRLLSCRNGVDFLEAFLDKATAAAEILDPARRAAIRAALPQYQPGSAGLFNAYEASWQEDQNGGSQYLFLEPHGEGLAAVSFEIQF